MIDQFEVLRDLCGVPGGDSWACFAAWMAMRTDAKGLWISWATPAASLPSSGEPLLV